MQAFPIREIRRFGQSRRAVLMTTANRQATRVMSATMKVGALDTRPAPNTLMWRLGFFTVNIAARLHRAMMEAKLIVERPTLLVPAHMARANGAAKLIVPGH